MNDEASPSTPDRDLHSITAALDQTPVGVASEERRHDADLKRKVKVKRQAFLEDVLRNLDILVYAEISAVYYMDCSFLRFAIRAFIQLLWLTPKPDILPEMPLNRPYIYPICGSNLVCLFLHIWLAAPSGGEATRGYLHGGLLIDWIGQQGPASKLRLTLLDFVICGLQLVMLAATLKLQKMKGRRGTVAGNVETTESAEATETLTGASRRRQDVDSEERGEMRRSSTSSDGIEQVPDETNELLGASVSSAPGSTAAALDSLVSGQAVIANLYVIDTVRDQFDILFNGRLASATPSSSGEDSARDFLARLRERRLANLRATLGAGVGEG